MTAPLPLFATTVVFDKATDIVWNPKKQSMLIDSMYRGFYIPPVVFSVHWDTSAEAKVRHCVDGKQRLTAISGFVSGRVRSGFAIQLES